MAESRIVGSNHPVSAAERVNETAELVRSGWEAVQEKWRRRVRPVGHRLAVEDAHAADFDVPVSDHCHFTCLYSSMMH